jgi:hypothetical protein
MPYEHILYEVADGRARITLNRPERRNALCPPLLDELEQALWDADDDKRVHCVILRGAGPAFAQVLQRLAAENDARGHLAPATKEYFRAVKEKGLAGAFRERDAKFGDGRACVEGPELRDERGFLLPVEKK